MSSTTRELVITYNSYACSLANGRAPIGFHMVRKDKDRGAVTFSFPIVAASEAAFGSACSAAETAFSAPFKDLTIVLGATTLLSVSQSGNTGLDCLPTITKAGQAGDSGRSRIYDVSIEFGLPASWNSTYPGLRDVTVSLGYTPARRREVTISGVFTAIDSDDAKAQYEEQIDDYASATMSWLGITTYELVREDPVEVSINRKTAAFSRFYQEIVFGQLGGGDDSGIVNQQLSITRSRLSAENSPLGAGGGTSQGNVLPLSDISATYDAWVDRDVTTDLVAKWTSIKDFVIQQIQSAVGGSFALMAESPTFHEDDNRITSTIRGLATDPEGSGTIQYTWEREQSDKLPPEFIPAWSGDPYAAFVYQAVGVRTRRTSTRKRTAAAAAPQGGAGGGSGGGGSLAFGSSGGAGGGILGASLGAGSDPGISPGQGVFGLGVGGTLSFGQGSASSPSGESVADNGGAAFGAAQAGGMGAGGGGTWYAIASRQGSRPLQVGRPPFVIGITETWTEVVERYASPIKGSITG